MAFPSGKNQLTLSEAFKLSRAKARDIKQKSIDLRDKSLTGSLTRKEVMEFPTTLADAIDDWNAASLLPGMAAYAQEQSGIASIGTEFTSMVTTSTGTRDWVVANFPSNGGFLLERSFDVNGRMVLGTLTSVQTAGFRTELDLLIAAIED